MGVDIKVGINIYIQVYFTRKKKCHAGYTSTVLSVIFQRNSRYACILSDTQSFDFVTSPDGGITTLDKTVLVSFALNNICDPVVPFDWIIVVIIISFTIHAGWRECERSNSGSTYCSTMPRG